MHFESVLTKTVVVFWREELEKFLLERNKPLFQKPYYFSFDTTQALRCHREQLSENLLQNQYLHEFFICKSFNVFLTFSF